MGNSIIKLLNSKIIFKILILYLLVLSSCSENNSVVEPGDTGVTVAKIAVFSDPHYFDPSLGTDAEKFLAGTGYSKKMFAESKAILQSTINEINKEDVNIVLISGDLTKDGERVSHQKLAEHLKELENSGAKVYVVPGNHDINNPNAMSYTNSGPTPTENISPAQFSEIYADYGYKEALYRDPNSLSYVAQPSDDIWIIGMDACRYDNNLANGYPETGGRFKPETYEWIKSKIQEGISKNKTLLGMMHHGLTEHFAKESEFFAPYVVEDFTRIRYEFASLGLKVMFTGHFHAQDIVKFQSGSDFIFDIETGSSVTWPVPFRIIELTSNNYLKITSDFINEIDYDTGGLTFQEYAKNFLTFGMPELIKTFLMNDYSLSETNADLVAPIMTDAIIAHYAGDENPSQETQNKIQQLIGNSDPTIQKIAAGLSLIWLDLLPKDNDLMIDLNNTNTNN
ncbi:MAG: metallophosphoesterase [Chlorobi bacterium]|nr:metallophosphoesterase [Chlorobiota bacterium]